jgi:hypothetical protein
LICRLQPLVHWEFMGLRTLRFRNYDDEVEVLMVLDESSPSHSV